MAKRALIAEEKQARRAVILSAAMALFNAGDGSLPTASQVANAAGLAKGTVYIYFRSKEEIFATLLLEGWAPIVKAISVVFDSSQLTHMQLVSRFITGLVNQQQATPELLRLDVHVAALLEKTMPRELLETYQSEFRALGIQAGHSIDHALQLPCGRGIQLLVRSHALTLGLWRFAQQGGSATDAQVPQAMQLTPDLYAQELAEALHEYWRGALPRHLRHCDREQPTVV